MVNNRKPLTGTKIGRLTVTEEIPNDITYSSNPYVKCSCACGKDHQVKLSDIQKRKTKSCGCLRVEQMQRFSKENNNNFIDKAGTRTGKWLYLGMEPNMPTGQGVYWKCQCDCGNLVVTRHKPSLNGCKECCDKIPKKRKERLICGDGYARIYKPDHLRANKAGYVLEHIVVMENVVGRPVTKTESVHHINGIRSDNRIENLELWDKAHPPGQRNSEKMEFYMNELKNKCNPALLNEFCKQILNNE